MATIRNPKNGRKIRVGGKVYNKLLEQGTVNAPGSIPSIENFIYIPHKDIWIRRDSTKYKWYLDHNHLVWNDTLVEKSVYNTSAAQCTIKMDKKAVQMILGCTDVLGLILSEASKCIRTYCCLRATSRRFLAIVSQVAAYEDILYSLMGKGKYRIKHLSTAPKRVAELYSRLYPVRFTMAYLDLYTVKEELVYMREILISLLLENEEFRDMAKDTFLRLCNDHTRSYYILKPFLKYLTFTEEEVVKEIYVYIPITKTGVRGTNCRRYNIAQLQEMRVE